MRDKVKKVINFRFDRYRDAELKLEKLAAKGLFLEECGAYFWTFRKGEPKNLKYTVTYFSEGSVFNPDFTDNQQMFFDYANAAGWNFVTQFNQMQIFSSESDHPVPFETEEKEKFDNIKRCMKKSFLTPTILLMLVFLLNLFVQFNSFQVNPIDFLSDSSQLLSAFMISGMVIFLMYTLLDYFVWCKRSEKSIANGGESIYQTSVVRRMIDILFLCFIFGNLAFQLLYLASKISGFGILLSIIQMPILLFLFWSSIKYLKKKKTSAMMNKVLSATVLILANIAYIIMMMLFILRSGFQPKDSAEYRTVNWQVTTTTTHDYKLFEDEIPLTCSDLYGEIDYDYYSYEKDIDSTFLLKKSSYRQDSLPAKDAPPEIQYDIYESKLDSIYRIVKNHLLEIPQWQENSSFESIDNEMFGTIEAYQKYYEDTPTGEYILIYTDKILALNLEEPATTEQVNMIKEKLLKVT